MEEFVYRPDYDTKDDKNKLIFFLVFFFFKLRRLIERYFTRSADPF